MDLIVIYLGSNIPHYDIQLQLIALTDTDKKDNS